MKKSAKEGNSLDSKQRSSSPKPPVFRIYALIISVLLLILGVFLFWQKFDQAQNTRLVEDVPLAQSGTPSMQAQIPPNESSSFATRNSESGMADAGQNTTNDTRDQEIDAEVPGSEIWFEDPKLQIDGSNIFFSDVPKIVIDWDPTCKDHPFTRFDDLSALAEKGLNVDPRDYLQSTHLALQFTQFWKKDGLYMQFGYKWEQNSPQTFSLEAYSSIDRYMSKDVKRLQLRELSDDPVRISGYLLSQLHKYLIHEVSERLSVKETHGQSSGSLGARLALIQASEKILPGTNVAAFQITLRNSTVTSVTSEQFTCSKSDKAPKALCVCRKAQ